MFENDNYVPGIIESDNYDNYASGIIESDNYDNYAPGIIGSGVYVIDSTCDTAFAERVLKVFSM